MITVLTGITDALVGPAPRIAEVLPSFLEFVGSADAGTVLVGHNVRFDIGFLDAALRAHGHPRLSHRRVDTVALARRLVRDEVPNLKLATLARHLRATTEPCHRALADARATVEVLHALLERAGTFGVFGLDDLIALPTMRMHPSSGKLALTARLPRAPGVYLFRDRADRVLYVGKAANLRSRVRSYFGGDDRRKVPQLLRETERIDHVVCADTLEAEVREVRLIQRHQPRFNRRAKAWRSYAYLELTLTERFPRLAVVREARREGSRYLGPFHSAAAAHAVREAIESAVPLRRCPRRVGRRAVIGSDGAAPCVPAQLGVAACPCSGHTDEGTYAAIVDIVARSLGAEPDLLLRPLEGRMVALAEAERYEEAALARDRLRALVRAFRRTRTVESLRVVPRVEVSTGGCTYEINYGRLALDGDAAAEPPLERGALPPRRDEIDELLVVGRWLARRAGRLRLDDADGTLVSALPMLRDYEPVGGLRSLPA